MHAPFKIDEEVNLTINSLDGIQRASPPPFFNSRLLSSLKEVPVGKWDKICVFISRPIIATFIIFIIIGTDFIAIFPGEESNDLMVEESIVTQYQELSSPSFNSFYDVADETDYIINAQ